MNLFELVTLSMYVLVGVAFVLWAFWTWRSFKKKKSALMTFQLIVFFGTLFWFTWSIRIFPGSKSYYNSIYNQQLTGEKFKTKLTYEYETTRDFNGDGYSIQVYHFDFEDTDFLNKPNHKFFSNHPVKPEYRNDWEQKRWSRTPMKDTERVFLDFGLSEYRPGNTSKARKLAELFEYIEKAMGESGSYYAYNYLMHDDNRIGNIDLFILLPNDKTLIVINHNT